MNKNSLMLICLILLALVLTACGPAQAPAPVAATELPTAAAQMTPAATEAAQPDTAAEPTMVGALPTETLAPQPVATITAAPSGVCKDAADSPYYARFDPIDTTGQIAYSGAGVTLVNPQSGAVHPVHPLVDLNLSGFDYSLAWSPDGSLLAFLHGPSGQDQLEPFFLMVADFAAGEICPLTDLPGLYSLPAWSPDGAQLAVTDGTRDVLTVIQMSDLTAENLALDAYGGIPPQWFDADRIGYITRGLNNTGDLVLFPLDGTKPSVLLNDVPGLRDFLFSPDAKALAYYGNGLNIRDLTGSSVKNLGDMSAMVWMPDSQTLLVQVVGSSTSLLDAQEDYAATELPFVGQFGRQSFSPDGQLAVFAESPATGNVTKIAVWDPASGEVTELALPELTPFDPAWSPK